MGLWAEEWNTGEQKAISQSYHDPFFPLPSVAPHPGRFFKQVKASQSANDSSRPADKRNCNRNMGLPGLETEDLGSTKSSLWQHRGSESARGVMRPGVEKKRPLQADHFRQGTNSWTSSTLKSRWNITPHQNPAQSADQLSPSAAIGEDPEKPTSVRLPSPLYHQSVSQRITCHLHEE